MKLQANSIPRSRLSQRASSWVSISTTRPTCKGLAARKHYSPWLTLIGCWEFPSCSFHLFKTHQNFKVIWCWNGTGTESACARNATCCMSQLPDLSWRPHPSVPTGSAGTLTGEKHLSLHPACSFQPGFTTAFFGSPVSSSSCVWTYIHEHNIPSSHTQIHSKHIAHTNKRDTGT